MPIPRFSHACSAAARVVLALALCTAPLATRPAGAASADDRFWEPDTMLPAAHVLVEGIAFDRGSMYVVGHFEDIDNSGVYHVARWDGRRWHLLGGGVGTPEMGLVHRILIDGNRIFVAGCFSMVGGQMVVCNIAMWNGAMWDMMMGGTDRAVRAIALDEAGRLYVGGEFTMAGRMPARGFAMWDGMRWSAPGGSVDNHVSSITVHNGSVYAGGAFRMAGGMPANYIARWDGQSWHALGEGLRAGMDNLVTALTVWQGDVYAGGLFRTAGGVRVDGIARWDGSQWYPVGGGVSGSGQRAVREFYSEPDRLYVGGLFNFAGGMEANCIASWDGRTWRGMGSGTDLSVKAFARAPDGTLWIGGDFETAGGSPSRHLARWTRWDGAPPRVMEFSASPSGAAVELTWNAGPLGAIKGFHVYRRNLSNDGAETRVTTTMLPPDARSYMDMRPPESARVEYALGIELRNGGEMRSDVQNIRTPALTLALAQNTPNPFTPSTSISFTLPRNERARIDVYDVGGKHIATLVDRALMAGPNTITWDGRSRDGRRVNSGIYFYRLSSESGTVTRKLMIVH